MKKQTVNSKLLWIGKWVGLPLLLYFGFFVFYSWPWITQFSSHFWTDSGDGIQNIWNIWWIDKSIIDLQQHPWHTTFLHHPYGISLLAQTLNPFNGFVAVGLLRFMSLAQAFNTMVLFSFVVGGLTAFWLCYEFSKRYLASLIGGFIFTFSAYHFAHAIGHMQLVSLEWIPLFLLLWWRLLTKPRYLTAIAAAVVLMLVMLCDYYYLFYSVIAAAIFLVYAIWRKRLQFKPLTRLLPLASFAATSLILVAPVPYKLLELNHRDKLLGGHPVADFSLNLPAVIVDGGFWRFAWLTDSVWSRIPGFIAETSVYLGAVVILALIVAWLRRRQVSKDLIVWYVIIIVFGVLSLGPRLVVFKRTVFSVPLPYAALEKLFPTLKLSGVPIRMMVIVSLAAAVIVAMLVAKLNLGRSKVRLLLILASFVLVLEYWPARLPATVVEQPGYVNYLKALPMTGIIDNAAESAPKALYNQTIHEHPMVLGYVSRTPASIDAKDSVLIAIITREQYDQLCSNYQVRYFSTPRFRPLNTNFPIVYRDHQAIIYDLKNAPNC